MDFHPSLPHVYIINELDSTLVTYRYDTEHGELTPTGQVVQTGSPVTIVFS